MDSVSYRVHFTSNKHGEYVKNRELVTALLMNTRANQSLIKNEIDFTSYQIPILANELALLPTDYLIKQMHWTQTDKRKDYIRGRFHLPSSHYDVGYRIDIDNEYVDISFSIPKYVYGHSVAQFVRNPHPTSTRFAGFKQSFDQVTSHWYNMFVQITKDFFSNTFQGIEIDYKSVEVVRIDLAFNQYFSSREEAVKVAELMANKSVSSLRGKRGREEHRTDKHSTGFVSVHRNMYYKVYHKGSEFGSVGDAKRLLKHNDKYIKQRKEFIRDIKKEYSNPFVIKEQIDWYDKNLRGYDLVKLQEEADLILRHEIRFVSKTMSEMYKKKIFRRNCPEYKSKKARYRLLDTKRKRYERTNELRYKLTDDEREEYLSIQRILQKRHRFFLETSGNIKQHAERNNGVHENYYKEAFFSPELMKGMIAKFQKIILDVQVKDLPAFDTLMKRIDEHNNIAYRWNETIMPNSHLKKKPIIGKKTMSNALDLIRLHGSLDKAFDKKKISKTTFYRLRGHMDLLGFSSTMSLAPIKLDTSFTIYFERLKGVSTQYPKYPVYFVNLKTNYLKRY